MLTGSRRRPPRVTEVVYSGADIVLAHWIGPSLAMERIWRKEYGGMSGKQLLRLGEL